MKIVKKIILTMLLLVSVISTANATSVTYDYVGHAFDNYYSYDTATSFYSTDALPSNIGPRITGSATFADGIDNPVTSYMLTDGINTISSGNINYQYFSMDFVDNNVSNWAVNLFDNFANGSNKYSSLFTFNYIYGDNSHYSTDQSYQYAVNINGGIDYNDFASNQYQPGTWTLRQDEVSSVPVPAALPLMASALGLFGLAKRRKQSV